MSSTFHNYLSSAQAACRTQNAAGVGPVSVENLWAELSSYLARLRDMTAVEPEFEELKSKVSNASRKILAMQMAASQTPKIAMALNPRTDLGLKTATKIFAEFGVTAFPYFLYNSSRIYGIIGDVSDLYANNLERFNAMMSMVDDRLRNVNVEFHSRDHQTFF